MSQPLPVSPVPYYSGAAEAAFGLEPAVVTGNTVTSAMQVGDWARSADGSAVHPGAAGVLIDVVTAYAALTARGADQWAVTSEITVDFHDPIPAGATRVLGAATADHATAGWGHSSGTLRDEDGTLLATLGQRVRYFPGDDSPHHQDPHPAQAPSWLNSLDERLELLSQDGPRTEFRLAHDPGMRNALGSLHGGVSLCFAELAARTGWEASLDFPGEPFRTSSLQVSYLRPGMLDDDFHLTVEIIHASRSMVIAEVRNRDAAGELLTFAVATLHRVATM